MLNLSIPGRLIFLACALLSVLVVSNLYLGERLSQSRQAMEADEQLVENLKTAIDANRSFGDFKYWLLELAVGPRQGSEDKALAARDAFSEKLDELDAVDKEAVSVLRIEIGSLLDTTEFAIEALQENDEEMADRFLGKGLSHIRVVDRRLADLVKIAESEVRVAREATLDGSKQAVEISAAVTILASLLGLALTYLVVRSITVPLRHLVHAMSALTSGNLRAEIPEARNDEIGAMARTLVLLRDSLAQRDLAERRLQDAIEAVSEGFSYFDRDDRLVICNKMYRSFVAPAGEALLEPGVTFTEVLEQTVRSGLVREAAGTESGWLERRLAQHRDPAGPHIHQRDDGRWLQVNEHKTSDGGTVAVYMDITDLKEGQLALREAKEQAEAATRIKSQFLANMSHELRTPLNAIIGIAEMVKEELDEGAAPVSPEEISEPLRRIVGAGRHLSRLIDEVLDLSKIEAGRLELQIEAFDIPALVYEVATTAEPLAAHGANHLEVSCEDDLGEMCSDVTRVRQILLNLLSNACKFTENGLVELAVRRAAVDDDGGGSATGPANGNFIEMVVRDNGIGMSREQLETVFDEFTQGDSSTTRRYGGTGLGLAITKRLCEILGGDISVRSELEEGTTFVVRLPADADEGPRVFMA